MNGEIADVTEAKTDRAILLAEALLSLTREELALPGGRARLAAALRNTLDALEGDRAGEPCARCVLRRPGVRRAASNMVEILTQAQEHMEFLAPLMLQPA